MRGFSWEVSLFCLMTLALLKRGVTYPWSLAAVEIPLVWARRKICALILVKVQARL